MGKKILIVDDEVDILKLIASRLSANQYEVVTAESGAEGLRKTLSEKPDLVIMDVLMPGMTGYQMLEKIRALQDGVSNVPIIVMSARPSMKRFFDTTHVRHFINKPFNPMDLLKEIEKTLTKPSQENNPTDESITMDGEEFLSEKNIVITGVDEYTLRKVSEYLQSKGHTVIRGHDEEDTLKEARKKGISVVLAQYWEESDKFNADKIYTSLKADHRTEKIECFVFCSESVGIEAMKSIPRQRIITFLESSDLIQKIETAVLNKIF